MSKFRSDTGLLSLFSISEVFSDPYHVVTTPWTVDSKICRAQIAVARAESLKEKVLRHPGFESMTEVDRSSPRAFPSDAIH